MRTRIAGLRWIRRTVVLGLASSLAFFVAAPAATAAVSLVPHFVTLTPGQHRLVNAQTHVNVVFIGYTPAQVDVNRMVSTLPAQPGLAVLRFPSYYAPPGIAYLAGLQYTYDYTMRFAGPQINNAFFNYLASSGSVRGPDFYQNLYNSQQHRTVTVGPQVRYIDARTTESWLEQHALSPLGLNRDDYTVFLVNWYGQPNFQFHVYTNLGRPDPDTGLDVASKFTDTYVRAWGGSSGPTWFYDLSAGPVWVDESWNVDNADLDGNGFTDYRIPSIWDYGSTGYRPFDDLSGDLGLVVRFVAIDQMFANSPVYDPLDTLPQPGTSKEVMLDIFEGDINHSGAADVHPDLIRGSLQSVEPYYSFASTVRDLPLAGGAEKAYEIATGLSSTPGCWNDYGLTLAEFFCYFVRDNAATYFPPDQNSIIPVAGFTTADDPITRVGFQGDSEDDWETGHFRLAVDFDTASVRDGNYGIGYTHTTTHESGHAIGLSHPHDAVDASGFFEYGPFDDFAFAWTGDEADSLMSYLPGNNSFDMFDRYNLARWDVARTLDAANFEAAAVLSRGPNPQANALLQKADGEFTAALASMRARQWVQAASLSTAGLNDTLRVDIATGGTPFGASTNGTPGHAGNTSAAPGLSSLTPAQLGNGYRPQESSELPSGDSMLPPGPRA